MANKFAFGLVAAGALTGICIGIGQAMTEHPSAAEVAPISVNPNHLPADLLGQSPQTSTPLVGNPDGAATCAGASKLSSGCSPEQAEANRQAYWDQQQEREAEMRADCRAGRISRDTCNQLVWDWETRV